MIRQSLETGHHEWDKLNTVTQKYGNKHYDIYKCKNCGIEGKSYQIGEIYLPNRFKKKSSSCPCVQQRKHTKLRVLCCTAFFPEFDNIIQGCILDILPPPPGEDNKLGEWVMGVSQPVLLLEGEFEYV